MGLMKKSIFTDQLSANIRYSLPNAQEYLKIKIDLKKLLEQKSNENNQSNIKKQFKHRLAPWMKMFISLKENGKIISQ